MDGQKTIAIGLDGAHFELIDQWIQAGKLPNIEQAIKTGISGDLRSVLPPVTSPNWKSYATGKNPGKLGIYWWENVDMDKKKVYYPSERRSQHPEFWEIIGNHSSAGMINVPTTYPPRETKPFGVAGAPDADEQGYTHPPELEAELQRELDYKVTKETPIKSRPNAAAEEIADLIGLRFRTGKYLLDKYDPQFLQITTFYLNSLHHFFWDDDRTLKGWKIIDEHLGDFLSEDYNIVLMSDHGSTDISTVFHINSWLENEGYLVRDMKATALMGELGITIENVLDVTTKLGIHKVAKRLAPQRLINQIPSDSGEVQRESKTSNIDWEGTTALASGQGPVYINSNRGNYEAIRTELISKLSNLTSPDGTPIAREVHRGEDIYNGEYVAEAPDIIIDQTSGVHIQGGLGRDDVFSVPQSDGWKGENKRNGLFVATGPDFTTGEVADLSILDLAPTLLHLHNCDVPADYDGDVRKDLYKDTSGPSTRNVSISEAGYQGAHEVHTEEDEENVRSRLEDLGYLE